MYSGTFYIDPLYLAILIITLVIAFATRLFMNSSYKRWSGVRNGAGLSGAQVGQRIISRTGLGVDRRTPVQVETPELRKLADLRNRGIVTQEEYEAKRQQVLAAQGSRTVSHIKFQRTSGVLTDHYDPRSRTVRMSDGVATQPSVASMAIVAHELGHAQQHENNSGLIKMRNVLVPAVNFTSPLSYLLILVGLLFYVPALFTLGIIFYAVMVLFTIVTLPVEFDASRRGLKLLDQSGLMQTEADGEGSRRVLTAAALTYVAAAVTAILQLLYYMSIARRRR